VSLPLRTRLVVLHVSLLALILGALFAFLVVRLRTDLVQGLDGSLATRAAQIALGLRGGGEGEFRDVSGTSLRGLPRGESAAQLIGPAGAVLETSGDPDAAGTRLIGAPDLRRVLDGSSVQTSIVLGPDREQFRVLAAPIVRPSGTEAIVVASSMESVNSSVRRLEALLIVAGPAALLAAGAGGWWLARRALRPVARMTDEAAEIGMHRLDERIDVPETSDEVARLAETLNAMLDRLEQGVEERRRFTADASHELRSPLAVMAAEIDVALRSPDLQPEAREVLTSAREEVDRMSATVEDLLTLARIDEGRLDLVRAPVDLRSLADSVAGKFATVAERRGIRLESGGDEVVVPGDRERLEQVVSNLVDNAMKFSGPGSAVRLQTWRDGGEAGLVVADGGPGIPPDQLPRVFDRFYRVDPARSRNGGGSGLGLAICREIVEAHGGRLRATSTLGAGSTFTISLATATTA
jgi:heavy metal sensor kinase